MRALPFILLGALAFGLAAGFAGCANDPGAASPAAGQVDDPEVDDPRGAPEGEPAARPGLDLDSAPTAPGRPAAPREIEEPCEAGWSDTFSAPFEVFAGAPGEGGPFAATFESCKSLRFFAILARGVEASLDLEGLPAGSFVEVTDALGAALGSRITADGGAQVRFTTSRSGEVRATIRRPEGRAAGGLQGSLSCLGGCGLEATRYPIVLFHGMAGTDRYFGVLDYYFEVPGHLRERGYEVTTPVTQFIGPSARRAEILAGQIDAILAETGAAKVHMIGHSQGGLDMRVLVSGLGYADRAASMTTIATPHGGIPIAVPEFLTGMDFGEGHLRGAFREAYPDIEAIARFSWAGRTCSALEPECRAEMNGEIVSPLLVVPYRLMQAAAREDGFEGANDGLVTVSSAIWGTFLGVLPADHLDEVGQIADQRQGPFDHRQFYLDEARRLRRLELTQDPAEGW